MKETQGQSWVIAAVRALRPRIRFLLFSFSLSTTPLPPSLPPSLSLSISPSSSPYPCGTRISTVPRYVRHDAITVLRTLPIATYRVFHEHFKVSGSRGDFLEETIRYPEICKVHRANVERTELVSLCSSNLHP